MRYSYIHPLKPQYFFPKGFKKHEVFISFFKPYSAIGKVSWGLFRNVGFYRILFGKTNIEAFIPEHEIRKIIGLKPLMAFNTGTPGPEQKITGLGWDKKKYFFIKYARTPLALKNVINEYNILKKLSALNFVPQIKAFHQENETVLLKTNVLTGRRLSETGLTEPILECLFKLSEISILSANEATVDLKTSFAHGDFCPWNLMEKEGNILVFDWEMAGNYPIGYDVFTFIFQTNFLLEPEKEVQQILSENQTMINKYFHHFKISDWKNYLSAFSKAKVNSEKKKGSKGMLSKYQVLLDYVKKA